MEVDDAIYCLDIHDHREMTAAQQNACNDLCEKDQFVLEFQTARSAVCGAIKLVGLPAGLPLRLEQSKVKQYIPPGSRCWRGNVRAEWWGEHKPFKCVFTALKDFGNDEHAAAVGMLQKLWNTCNMSNGIPLNQCPLKGIVS